MAASLVIGMAFTGDRAALAQDQTPIAGRVVDKDGKGVAGATLWAVISGSEDAAGTVAETRADDQGKFSFAKLPAPSTGNAIVRRARGWVGYDLVARAKDGRLAWIGLSQVPNQATTDLRLPLVERADIRGRLVDQDGKPIAGAEITPSHVIRQEKPGRPPITATLPAAVSSPLRVTTAPEGSFVLAQFPQVSQVLVKIQAEGLSTVNVGWNPPEPITITLDRRPGRIVGRFKLPDQRRLEGSSTIALSRIGSRNESAATKVWIGDNRRATVDPDGKFQFEGVLPGRYLVNPDLDPAVPFLAPSDSNNPIDVEPGATAEAPEIRLEPTVTVTGRVIDAETEKGIQGVTVSGYTFSPHGGSATNLPPTETDAEGRYRLKAVRGTLRVMAGNVPKPYANPDNNQNAKLEVSGDRTWPDMKLSRGTAIDGIVVDGTGRPVAGAEILVLGSVSRSFNMPGDVKSGPDGSFHLDGLPPGSIAIRAYARDKGAMTRGAIVVRTQDQKGKLTITVDPKFAFRVHGTVTDRSGKPIPGARVMVHWMRQMPSDDPRSSGSTGTSWDTYSTDAAGRFETSPLYPGDQYTLNVTAEGYTPFQSPEIIGTPGMSKGLGKIRLVGTGGYIAGIVVGSDGKPIPDVTVFNRGNSLETVTTRTDAHGRFRLEKLFPGHKYAFARKDGHRFTAALVEGDRDDLTIRLLRGDEPPPPWKPAEGLPVDEQRELARRILLRLWEVHSQRPEGQAREEGLTALVLPMAQVDPATALEWSGQLGEQARGSFEAQVKLAGAEVLAAFDARAAIEVIKKTPEPAMALEQLLQLATWFADNDPTRALPFAREAAAQARTIDKASSIRAKARAGGLLIRLGQGDEGRTLVEEAVAALPPPAPGVAKPPVMGPIDPGLFPVARALALFDPKRARALIEPFQQQYYRDRLKGLLASAIAMTDPAQAVELVKGPGNRQSDWYNTLIEVVYRCGDQRPDEALKIVDGMSDDLALAYRAEALGWLAVAVSKRDRKRAFALIDQALAVSIDQPSASMHWRSSGGADAAAARVALCARRVGYPDMDSVLARVLAARSIPGRSPWGGSGQSSAVALVALLDPAVAREMLLQAEAGAGSLLTPGPQEGGSPSRRAAFRRQDVELIARTLADPAEARQTIDAALAEVGNVEGPSPQTYALIELARVLAASPTRREEILWGQPYDTWYPGRLTPGE